MTSVTGETGQRRPRVTRHAAAGALVATYLLAAAVVIAARRLMPVPQWLALHLLVLGAATNAVLVWSRFFAQALLHARGGSERPAWLRVGLLNAGVILVLAGVGGHAGLVAAAGAAVVVAVVIAHTASLLAMARASALAGPLAVLVRYYAAAGAALVAGGALGGLLAAGWIRSPRLAGAVTLAHAELNLLGWLGLAVIGTQFMLWPMVVRTRVGGTAPRTARRVLVLTAGGLAVTAAALLVTPWFGAARWLAAAGMAAYLAGVVDAARPAASQMRAKPPRTAPAWGLLAGYAWLIIAIAADIAGLAAGPGQAGQLLGRVLIPVLGAGVIAQVLTGALTYLLPVTVGGGPAGNRRITAILERGWRTRAILGNAGVLTLLVLAAVHGGGTGWLRAAAWAAILAGFGTFPLLAVVALAGRRLVRPR